MSIFGKRPAHPKASQASKKRHVASGTPPPNVLVGGVSQQSGRDYGFMSWDDDRFKVKSGARTGLLGGVIQRGVSDRFVSQSKAVLAPPPPNRASLVQAATRSLVNSLPLAPKGIKAKEVIRGVSQVVDKHLPKTLSEQKVNAAMKQFGAPRRSAPVLVPVGSLATAAAGVRENLQERSFTHIFVGEETSSSTGPSSATPSSPLVVLRLVSLTRFTPGDLWLVVHGFFLRDRV